MSPLKSDTFYPERHLVVGGARATDPDTSHDAGGSTPIRVDQAFRLLACYASHVDGLTAVEAGTLLGMDRPDRRVSDLFTAGYLRLKRDEYGAVVKRRPFNVGPKYGREGRVLVITGRGIKLVGDQMAAAS